MAKNDVERLTRVHALLSECGMVKTIATLTEEAAHVGANSKAVQEFLGSCAGNSSESSSSQSFKSAKDSQSSEDAASSDSSSDDSSAMDIDPMPSPPAMMQRQSAGTPAQAKAGKAAGASGFAARRGEAASTPNTPFCRIKPEDVVYTDDRLKDNGYMSKGDVSGDFGYKAHRDLIVTRGKAFTKEKNKKKRGSYTGGKITMQSCSIKFT